MQALRPQLERSLRRGGRASRCRKPVGRRGTSPVEFVLTLPILLFVMALMINFGTMASWKARASVVARQAVWRQRYDRTGATDPQITGWPGQMGVGGGNSLFNDPFAQFPVVRGPAISAPNANAALIVDQNLLDITQGVQTGTSAIQVQMPLLPGLPQVSFAPQAPLLSGRWQFGNIGLPQNVWRRIPLLYPQLRPDTFFSRVPQQQQAYINAGQAILNATFRPELAPLDRDDEFYAYYLQQYGAPPPIPDFHPRIQSCSGARINPPPGPESPNCRGCELDPATVRIEYISNPNGLISRIRGIRGGGRGGVPETMARAFIALYQQQINQLNQTQPPNQVAINGLQSKIDKLNEFIGTLN